MEKYIGLLKKSFLFSEIKEEEILTVLDCLKGNITNHPKNTYIYEAGDRMTNLCLLLDGQVHVINDDYWGNQNIMSVITPGDIFGESYVLSDLGQLMDISVYCTADAEVLNLSVRHLMALCPKRCNFHHQIILNLVTIIARKNLNLMKKLNHVSQRTTRDKLLAYLTSQKIQHAGKDAFHIPFNRQQLADYLGVDRSAMSNELGKMRDEGLIEFNKNYFELK